jgi:hypothetical protein
LSSIQHKGKFANNKKEENIDKLSTCTLYSNKPKKNTFSYPFSSPSEGPIRPSSPNFRLPQYRRHGRLPRTRARLLATPDWRLRYCFPHSPNRPTPNPSTSAVGDWTVGGAAANSGCGLRVAAASEGVREHRHRRAARSGLRKATAGTRTPGVRQPPVGTRCAISLIRCGQCHFGIWNY